MPCKLRVAIVASLVSVASLAVGLTSVSDARAASPACPAVLFVGVSGRFRARPKFPVLAAIHSRVCW